MVIDPKGHTPSHAQEGNLKTPPTTTVSSSPLPEGPFLAPIKDLPSVVHTSKVDRQLDHDYHDESRV